VTCCTSAGNGAGGQPKSVGSGGFRLVTFGRELTVQAKPRASALNADGTGRGQGLAGAVEEARGVRLLRRQRWSAVELTSPFLTRHRTRNRTADITPRSCSLSIVLGSVTREVWPL
jgi:hypothetical protein